MSVRLRSLLHRRRDLLVGACAASAGVHAALVPAHAQEGLAAGATFAAAAVALVAVAVALTVRPGSRSAAGAAVLVLGGLVLSYVAASTVGLPLLHSDSEGVDALALGTKLVEVAALALAVGELRASARSVVPLPFTALLAVVVAFGVLPFAGGHPSAGHEHAPGEPAAHEHGSAP